MAPCRPAQRPTAAQTSATGRASHRTRPRARRGCRPPPCRAARPSRARLDSRAGHGRAGRGVAGPACAGGGVDGTGRAAREGASCRLGCSAQARASRGAADRRKGCRGARHARASAPPALAAYAGAPPVPRRRGGGGEIAWARLDRRRVLPVAWQRARVVDRAADAVGDRRRVRVHVALVGFAANECPWIDFTRPSCGTCAHEVDVAVRVDTDVVCMTAPQRAPDAVHLGKERVRSLTHRNRPNRRSESSVVILQDLRGRRLWQRGPTLPPGHNLVGRYGRHGDATSQ
eukprot:5914288-Prymnesium_polylepis.1